MNTELELLTRRPPIVAWAVRKMKETGTMADTVWKLPIQFKDEFTVTMPKGADILFVGTQNDVGFFWARVDPKAVTEERVALVAAWTLNRTANT